MTETQITALEAFIPQMNLAGKLEWRQRVLDALTKQVNFHDSAAEKARDDSDHAADHEHKVHAATLAGFRDVAKMGGNWKRWLYMVDLTADETAWLAYVAECEAENLNAHDPHMWRVHGCPTGPI